MLPEIRPSAEIYGEARGQLAGVPVAAALGDQQAALFGQTCFSPGDAKCTYGTGSFLLMNTGGRPVLSSRGLLTTVACRVGDEAPTYALEGSIAVTGALVQWFRDNLTLIGSALWCFAFAGAGWAAGASYERFHHDFAYVEYAVVAGIVALAAYLFLRLRRSSTMP